MAMPFCVQCGNPVRPADVYCASCGTRQPSAPSGGFPSSATNPSPKTASMLCYVPYLGWIASVIVLASSRFRADRIVRFHAFQGLYLFVAWLLVDLFLGPLFREMHGHGMAAVVKVILFGTGVFLLIKTSQGEVYRLPVLGDLADKSVSEQV